MIVFSACKAQEYVKAVWTELIIASLVFLASHVVPVRPPVRPWLVARLGPKGFTLSYSVFSLAIMIWLIGAVGRAPYVPLWPDLQVLRLAGICLVFAACFLLALALGRPNPFSFGGGPVDRYEPERPGLLRYTRHPLLIALSLWGIGHMLMNGDLAHALLFAVLASFAMLGTRALDLRRKRSLGSQWHALDERRRAARVSWNLTAEAAVRIVAGVALFATIWVLHGPVIGVAPGF